MKKRISIVLAMAISLVLASVTISSASVISNTINATFTVSGNVLTVSSATQLQSALGNATAGDTILVTDDIVLDQTLSINKSVTIKTKTNKKITLNGSGTQIAFDADRVSLNGFTIVKDAGQPMVNMKGSDYSSIINNTFTTISNGIENPPMGINLGDSTAADNATITGNTFTGIWSGIYITQGNRANISGNTFTNMKESAISIEQRATEVSINDNTTTNSKALVFLWTQYYLDNFDQGVTFGSGDNVNHLDNNTRLVSADNPVKLTLTKPDGGTANVKADDEVDITFTAAPVSQNITLSGPVNFVMRWKLGDVAPNITDINLTYNNQPVNGSYNGIYAIQSSSIITGDYTVKAKFLKGGSYSLQVNADNDIAPLTITQGDKNYTASLWGSISASSDKYADVEVRFSKDFHYKVGELKASFWTQVDNQNYVEIVAASGAKAGYAVRKDSRWDGAWVDVSAGTAANPVRVTDSIVAGHTYGTAVSGSSSYIPDEWWTALWAAKESGRGVFVKIEAMDDAGNWTTIYAPISLAAQP